MREWTEPTTIYEDVQPIAARRLDRQVRWLFGAGAYAGAAGATFAVAVGVLLGATRELVILAAVIVLLAIFVLVGWAFLHRRPPEHRWSCHLWRIVYAVVVAVAAIAWGMLAASAYALWPEPQAVTVGVLVLLGLAALVLTAAFWLPLGVVAALLAGVSAWRSIGSPDLDDWSGPGGVLTLACGLLLMAGLWSGMVSRWLLTSLADASSKRNIIGKMQHDLVEQERQIKVESDHRNRVERELTLAHDAAESAIRAKTEFLATMSHEIRTPLNGILPILELLLDTPLSTDQREYVDTAHKSSRHLLRLINDVLDFAKVEAGKLELEYIEIQLDEMIGSVTDLMRRTAERKGLELRVSIDPEAPEAVRGDPIRLRQVLTNLVSNAVKFPETASVSVEIKQLRVGWKEVNLRFSVVDTGIGMNAGTAKRLFQSFTQADASTTRKHGGTGLGLVICKRLVELMGGEIGVHSQPDRGSTFWFELPMRRSKHDIPPARQDLTDVRVLTIIKDPQERARVSAWLDGWQVMEERAESAIAAISKLKTSAMLGESWAFELVLADTRKQEQAVTTVVRELRAEPELASLPVLVAGSGIEPSLTDHPSVVRIEAPIRKQELRRVLVRILDVEELGVDSPTGRGDSRPQFDPFSQDSPALLSAGDGVAPDKLSGRALLVEDNPVNSAVARKLLQHLGVDCVIAEDGVAALDCLEVDRFDIVLMDLQMPHMDGFEATDEIRKREAEGRLERIPIIAITANAMRGDREKCLARGMDDYLSKPLDMENLKVALARWLSVSARRTTLTATSTVVPSQRDPAPAPFDEEYSLNDELIAHIGKIADTAGTSRGASQAQPAHGHRPLRNDGFPQIEERREARGQAVQGTWDEGLDDDFPELDSALVRELVEDDWDVYPETEQQPAAAPAPDPMPTAEAPVCNEPRREDAAILDAGTEEFAASLEPESMPTDLDWLASHEQIVEVIEITSNGATHDKEHRSRAAVASIAAGGHAVQGLMPSDDAGSQIDAKVLNDLREVMEDEFGKILSSYLKNAPLQLETLEDAAKAGDIDTMIRPAHSLKSSSANVGAMRVSELAKEIETNARERQRTAAVAALPELREAFDAARYELAGIAEHADS